MDLRGAFRLPCMHGKRWLLPNHTWGAAAMIDIKDPGVLQRLSRIHQRTRSFRRFELQSGASTRKALSRTQHGEG